MPTGTPRSPLVRSIDERLGLAQREIRELELARAALQRAEGAPPRRRRRKRLRLAELDEHLATGRRPVAA